jgi:hypothetical protein
MMILNLKNKFIHWNDLLECKWMTIEVGNKARFEISFIQLSKKNLKSKFWRKMTHQSFGSES